jgi:hypothetical protein
MSMRPLEMLCKRDSFLNTNQDLAPQLGGNMSRGLCHSLREFFRQLTFWDP